MNYVYRLQITSDLPHFHTVTVNLNVSEIAMYVKYHVFARNLLSKCLMDVMPTLLVD